MKQSEIKAQLIGVFEKEFDINSKIDIYNTKTQAFDHDVFFEWQDDQDNWHDAQMNVCGTIYKNVESVENYNPIGDGRCGEDQGGGVFIDSWQIGDVEFFVDGKMPEFTITIEELLNVLKL